VQRYKSLADIERAFRLLKSDIDSGLVQRRLPKRIRAHALVCFMALILYRVMRMRLKASNGRNRRRGCCSSGRRQCGGGVSFRLPELRFQIRDADADAHELGVVPVAEIRQIAAQAIDLIPQRAFLGWFHESWVGAGRDGRGLKIIHTHSAAAMVSAHHGSSQPKRV
jgi:hypothetical protein